MSSPPARDEVIDGLLEYEDEEADASCTPVGFCPRCGRVLASWWDDCENPDCGKEIDDA